MGTVCQPLLHSLTEVRANGGFRELTTQIAGGLEPRGPRGEVLSQQGRLGLRLQCHQSLAVSPRCLLL